MRSLTLFVVYCDLSAVEQQSRIGALCTFFRAISSPPLQHQVRRWLCSYGNNYHPRPTTFSFRIHKFRCPHVVYPNRIRLSTRIRSSDSLWYPGLLCSKISPEHAPRETAPCAAILVYCSVRGWAWFCHVIGFENIRIHSSTHCRIRCGFIFSHSGDLERILKYPDSLSSSLDACGRKPYPGIEKSRI